MQGVLIVYIVYKHVPHRVGLLPSLSPSHVVIRGNRPGQTKDRQKMVQTASLHYTHALGFDSAAQRSKRPGSVWNCLWGLKRSPGINYKSMVLYPGSGFLSSATWHPMPKKHNNGLINQ